MPLTDVQIRSLNGGQKPVKPGNEKSGPPKVRKPKNTTKGVGARLAKTDDEPKFIVTTKPYKMADGAGLYLEVDPSGGKYWRFKYRRAGKEKRISLGVYPEVSLANARKSRDGCRSQLAQGIDPGVARKAQAAAQSSGDANSFEVVAREWLKEHVDPKSESHSKRVYARFENDVFPRCSICARNSSTDFICSP